MSDMDIERALQVLVDLNPHDSVGIEAAQRVGRRVLMGETFEAASGWNNPGALAAAFHELADMPTDPPPA